MGAAVVPAIQIGFLTRVGPFPRGLQELPSIANVHQTKPNSHQEPNNEQKIMAPSWMMAAVVALFALLAQSVGASSRQMLADPTIYRAKNDAGICYPVEGFFGGPNRKECVPVSNYKFYYTCCEEGTPKDAVNRLFDPSTFRKVFGGNDCQQQPDTIITKCRGSKDHEYCCTRKRA